MGKITVLNKANVAISFATKGFDIGMGIGGAVGGYAYDKVTSGALEGSVFDI